MSNLEPESGLKSDRPSLIFQRLGRVGYQRSYELQQRYVTTVQGWREHATTESTGPVAPAGIVLLLEHDPVVTISNRPSAQGNLLASTVQLASAGVEVAMTDRGGDITYHGPGQLVAYPIVDLNRLHLRLHEYMRCLERAVIRVCNHFGVAAAADPEATGVWVGLPHENATKVDGAPARKICAMGIRVRQWVSLHGLALNVSTNLSHFGLIVPCGLVGRPVTSLRAELGDAACPTMEQVMDKLTIELADALRCTSEPMSKSREAHHQ